MKQTGIVCYFMFYSGTLIMIRRSLYISYFQMSSLEKPYEYMHFYSCYQTLFMKKF